LKVSAQWDKEDAGNKSPAAGKLIRIANEWGLISRKILGGFG
jgi:hypothetical protein